MELWVKPWLEEIDTILRAVVRFIRMVIEALLSKKDDDVRQGFYNEKQKPKTLLEHTRTPKLQRMLRSSTPTRATGNLPSKTSND